VATHILLRGIPERLAVPRDLRPLPKCFRYQAPAALAGKHSLVKGLHIPATQYLSAKARPDLVKLWLCDQIAELVGIDGQIVELVRIGWTVDVLVATAADHNAGSQSTLTQDLGHDRVGSTSDIQLAAEQRHQAAAIDGSSQSGFGLAASQLNQGRQDVQQGSMFGNATRPERLRGVEDKGYADRPLEEAHLVPKATLPQHLTVIRGKENYCVLGQSNPL
jgi:hypothetical protein